MCCRRTPPKSELERDAGLEIARIFTVDFTRRLSRRFSLNQGSLFRLRAGLELTAAVAFQRHFEKKTHGTCRSCRGCQVRVRSPLTAASGQLPDHVVAALESEGQTLDPALRRHYERLMNVPLPAVILHFGVQANRSASILGVAGYTVGCHVVLANSGFTPGTRSADALLAHEFTHVLQQQAGISRPAIHGPELARELELQAEWVADIVTETTRERRRVNFELSPGPFSLQALNPIIAKCGAICQEVIIDPTNGVPCGLVDCDFLGFFPPVIARSFCVYSCAVNRYAAFIINTNFGRIGHIFTGRPGSLPPN
jgi:hypothetical protein